MNVSANSSHLPVVDIALATFNGERYLPALLDSIKQQTHRNWHLIAGDDGSTDKTMNILHTFAAANSARTTLLPATDRRGTKENFSRILQAGCSDYTVLADQDDVWLPKKIEQSLALAQTIENENTAGLPVLVHSDASVTNDSLEILDPSLWHHQNLNPDYGMTFKNLMVQNVITGCTALFNRALLERTLPIPDECIMHDWWIALTAAAFGRIDYLTTPLLLYRQHADNQIGAKQWSARHVVSECASGIRALKTRIKATQQQAETFHSRFAGQSGQNIQDFLHAYEKLSHLGPIRRRLLAARYGFHKCGMVRTAGFYTAL
jgi:glycosyltransferase involved in cell wall biosynthesis